MPLKRRACLAATSVLWLQPWLLHAQGSDRPVAFATVGRRAPPFTLVDSKGQSHSLGAVVGAHTVTVLNFWATWCAPCVKELPDFDEVFNSYARESRRVAVLGLNAMESPEKVRTFAQRVAVSFPLLLDPDGEVLGSYVGFSAGLPVTFLIDARGVVRQRINGPLSASALNDKIQALLAAPPAR